MCRPNIVIEYVTLPTMMKPRPLAVAWRCDGVWHVAVDRRLRRRNQLSARAIRQAVTIYALRWQPAYGQVRNRLQTSARRMYQESEYMHGYRTMKVWQLKVELLAAMMSGRHGEAEAIVRELECRQAPDIRAGQDYGRCFHC